MNLPRVGIVPHDLCVCRVTAVQGSDASRQLDDDTLAHKSGEGEAAALTTNNLAKLDESRGRQTPCSPSNWLEAWPPNCQHDDIGNDNLGSAQLAQVGVIVRVAITIHSAMGSGGWM